MYFIVVPHVRLFKRILLKGPRSGLIINQVEYLWVSGILHILIRAFYYFLINKGKYEWQDSCTLKVTLSE